MPIRRTKKAEVEGAASMPADLSERSQRLWTSLVGGRAKSPERIALLESALRSLDRADEAAEILKRDGLIVRTGRSKFPHAHPALKVEKDSRALFARHWALLGFEFYAPVDGAVGPENF